MAAVKKNNKWGFVDKKGNEKIPLIYEEAYFFKDGIAKVSDGRNRFYIDKENKWKKDVSEHEEH